MERHFDKIIMVCGSALACFSSHLFEKKAKINFLGTLIRFPDNHVPSSFFPRQVFLNTNFWSNFSFSKFWLATVFQKFFEEKQNAYQNFYMGNMRFNFYFLGISPLTITTLALFFFFFIGALILRVYFYLNHLHHILFFFRKFHSVH